MLPKKELVQPSFTQNGDYSPAVNSDSSPYMVSQKIFVVAPKYYTDHIVPILNRKP